MPILYDNPKEVGRRPHRQRGRRAFDLYGGPTIVVDFGTATTFDAISADGEYLGGAIVPGIEISLDALFGRAAALRRVELVEPRNVIGKKHGRVDPVGRGLRLRALRSTAWCAAFEKELGECTVIATGGLAGLIAPCPTPSTTIEPWLTLHGLRLVYREEHGRDEQSALPLRARPHRRRRSHEAASTRSTPADETGLTVTVAGRLMLRRVQGKLAFGTLAGRHRSHPAVRTAQATARFDEFTAAVARRLGRRHRRGREDQARASCR